MLKSLHLKDSLQAGSFSAASLGKSEITTERKKEEHIHKTSEKKKMIFIFFLFIIPSYDCCMTAKNAGYRKLTVKSMKMYHVLCVCRLCYNLIII